MKKIINSMFIVALTTILLFSLTSCGKSHDCIGYWKGKTYYGQYIYLTINKKGNYSMDVFPHEPDVIPQLSRDPRYTYSGKWEKESDDVIKMPYDSFSNYDGKERNQVYSNGEFYLQGDGSLTQNNMNFSNPICKLSKIHD